MPCVCVCVYWQNFKQSSCADDVLTHDLCDSVTCVVPGLDPDLLCLNPPEEVTFVPVIECEVRPLSPSAALQLLMFFLKVFWFPLLSALIFRTIKLCHAIVQTFDRWKVHDPQSTQ